MTNEALTEIHAEIERASERRIELWHLLSLEHDPALQTELKELNAELDRLWDEHRAIRARLRFGDREKIVARARGEERLGRAAQGPEVSLQRGIAAGTTRPDPPRSSLRRLRCSFDPKETPQVDHLEEHDSTVARVAAALEAQRKRLAEVHDDYEKRRRVLTERARELEEERAALRRRAAELEAREAAPAARERAEVEPAPASPAPPVPALRPRPLEAT